MIEILLQIGMFLSGAVVMRDLYSRERRLTRQFLVVKLEAIRLKAIVPHDLWVAIAPYEKD